MASRVRAAIDGAIAAEHQRRVELRSQAHTIAALIDSALPRSVTGAAEPLLHQFGLDAALVDVQAANRRRAIIEALGTLRRDRADRSRRAIPNPAAFNVPTGLDDPPSFPVCFFPADTCDGAPAPNQCDAAHALLTMFHDSTGLGGKFGILAFPQVPSITSSLWYGFMPPFGGALNVLAQVLVTGLMGVYTTFDSPLASLLDIGAEARLTLRLSVHQGKTIQSTESVVVSMDCSGSSTLRYHPFVDDLFVLTLYSQVQDDEPVAIQVSADLYAAGRSDYGHGFLNFNTFFDDGILVPALCLFLAPNAIL